MIFMLKLNKISNKNIIIFTFLLLFLITIFTQYHGSNDAGEYADTGKFFAGEYAAKIRGSHSYLYGFIHSPFIWLTKSFFIYKITSLIFLSLIIYSVYLIGGRNIRTFWLMLFSPIVWYMAPWINPLQLAGLLLLWAYYFIEKHEETGNIKFLFFSGVFLGLGWAFWDTILFFGVFLAIAFLYNKKVSHLFYFAIFVFIGLAPRLVLDTFLFNFPFASILKSVGGTIVNNLSSGIYMKTGRSPFNFANILTLLIIIPIFYWKFYKPSNFIRNKKPIIFLTLSLLLILSNPQARYLIAIIPIIIVLLGKHLNKKQFKLQLTIFAIISLLVIVPYVVQIKYTTNAFDINAAIDSFGGWNLNSENRQEIILNDLEQIISQYPNEVLLIGNNGDEYAGFARLYWNEEVKEFVSTQDYDLYLRGESDLFEKRITFTPKIQDRRQIWIAGGLEKNINDATDYDSISYGIGVDEPLDTVGFNLIEKYEILYLSKRTI